MQLVNRLHSTGIVMYDSSSPVYPGSRDLAQDHTFRLPVILDWYQTSLFQTAVINSWPQLTTTFAWAHGTRPQFAVIHYGQDMHLNLEQVFPSRCNTHISDECLNLQ